MENATLEKYKEYAHKTKAFYQENIKGYLKSSSLSKEGVENYIANRINPTLDYQTSLQELKNSRYSLSMFKRIILKSLLV